MTQTITFWEIRKELPEPIARAVAAAFVATNYRPADILDAGEKLAKEYQKLAFDSKTCFHVIELALRYHRAKPFVSEVPSAKRRITLQRNGTTNVIRIYFSEDLKQPVRAFVLDSYSVYQEACDARRRRVKALTTQPIANFGQDEGDGYSTPLRTRMVMKGRLAAISRGAPT